VAKYGVQMGLVTNCSFKKAGYMHGQWTIWGGKISVSKGSVSRATV